MRKNSAFTLVEIMIVVSIIALLVLIALPSFLRARQESQNAKFINELRVLTSAFQLYAADHNGSYPAEVKRGIISPEMETYFGPTVDWTAPTPIGGTWDWDYNKFGFTAGVSVDKPSASTEQLIEIDQKIDDGDLSSGHFQHTTGNRYTDILE
jgi:prepilin-type N-terminal cleavage/methylation domain-containing protein